MFSKSELVEWYAGLTNLDLGVASEEMGHGLTLSPAYVHVMAHAMLAFKPPKPGKPHEGLRIPLIAGTHSMRWRAAFHRDRGRRSAVMADSRA